MHLIETYALNCGLKIEKPHIKIEEIELPSKKYITIHSHCEKGPGRNYRNWNNVILELISNNKVDFEIVHIGGANFEDLVLRAQTIFLPKSFLNLGYSIRSIELASF